MGPGLCGQGLAMQIVGFGLGLSGGVPQICQIIMSFRDLRDPGPHLRLSSQVQITNFDYFNVSFQFTVTAIK